ncbi:MAG: PQQ-binding-like beta-propeller repeat protein [Spirochaetaceae bacterium]|nr:PQQ-binding-like beta-propeller repeat protein [Spirochaetaceae bacterium]
MAYALGPSPEAKAAGDKGAATERLVVAELAALSGHFNSAGGADAGKAFRDISLASPALALLAGAGEGAPLFVVAGLDGSLAAYGWKAPPSEEAAAAPGRQLDKLWEVRLETIEDLLALPGDKAAALASSGRLRVLDLKSGAELWKLDSGAKGLALAYAPGILVAAIAAKTDKDSPAAELVAIGEADGRELWRRALGSRPRFLTADQERIALLESSGELTIHAVSSGEPIAQAAARLDPGLPAILANGRLLAGLAGGGSAEFDAATGALVRSWPPGEASEGAVPAFIAADEDRLFEAQAGKLLVRDRRSAEGTQVFSERFGAGFQGAGLQGGDRRDGGAVFAAASGAVVAGGGLWFLGARGELFELGSGRESAASPLSGLAPPQAVAEAILVGMEKFIPRGGAPLERYLGFDLFAEGLPLDPEPLFLALRIKPDKSGKRIFLADAKGGRILLALYGEEGVDLGSNVEELGTDARLERYLDAGKTYWLVTGRISGEEGRYRVLSR